MPSRWVSATRASPAGGAGAGDGSGVTAGADGVGSTVGVTDAMAGKADVLASTTLVDGAGLDEAGAVQPTPTRVRTAASTIGRRPNATCHLLPRAPDGRAGGRTCDREAHPDPKRQPSALTRTSC